MEAMTPVAAAATTASVATPDSAAGVAEAFARASAQLKKKPPRDEEIPAGAMLATLLQAAPPLPARLASGLLATQPRKQPLNGATRHLASREATLAGEGLQRLARLERGPQAERPDAALRDAALMAAGDKASTIQTSSESTLQGLLPQPTSMQPEEGELRQQSGKGRSLAESGLAQLPLLPQGETRIETLRQPAAGMSAPAPRMNHQGAAPELPQTSRSSVANGDLVYRFQRWGADHAVMIQPQQGGTLSLQSSDALVHARLDEHWHSGNPQQWQLSRDGEEGRQRHESARQDEDEEA